MGVEPVPLRKARRSFCARIVMGCVPVPLRAFPPVPAQFTVRVPVVPGKYVPSSRTRVSPGLSGLEELKAFEKCFHGLLVEVPELASFPVGDK
jgi:hypothetical protein